MRDNGTCTEIDVINFFNSDDLELALRSTPSPITSWEEMRATAIERYHCLRFTKDAFDPLRGHPFVHGAAHRIIELLEILDRIRNCMDEKGQLTTEGERLYQDHFVGEKAWFSDSSDSEKRDFKAKLTFRHPEKAGQALGCTWHGKVKWPQIRIHFSWPVPIGESLYIAYVGPKITKR